MGAQNTLEIILKTVANAKTAIYTIVSVLSSILTIKGQKL